MSKISTLNALAASVVVSALGVSVAHAAAANPFAASDITGGYQQLADNEGSCGNHGGDAAKGDKSKEGKCGADKMKKEGKCGEGKCGDKMMKDKKDKAGKEGKCGDKSKHEGKCGGDKKDGAATDAAPAAPAAAPAPAAK